MGCRQRQNRVSGTASGPALALAPAARAGAARGARLSSAARQEHGVCVTSLAGARRLRARRLRFVDRSTTSAVCRRQLTVQPMPEARAWLAKDRGHRTPMLVRQEGDLEAAMTRV
eukprot:352791-Chlamydomonas_euryale.AAC.1